MSHQAPPDNAVDVPAVLDYRLLHVIGRGAFGEVWLAEERLTGLPRAVKVLRKAADPAHALPLRELSGIREYQQKARGHDCLVQVFHVGETPECFYYVMELADDARVPHPSGVGDGLDALQREDSETSRFEERRGEPGGSHSRVPRPSGVGDIRARFEHDEPGVPPGAGPSASDRYEPLTLAALIEREAPVPAARALDITAQVLRGLEHLHDQGLIHRDVKPSNVLVVDGRIKLGDMGLVTPMDRDVTLVFTPGYAPSDAKVDHTFDLFATGIILYEMLTGLHRSEFPILPAFKPRSGRERRELRAAIHIANKAANPDRRLRYTSASTFLRDLQTPRTYWRPSRAAKLGVGVALLMVAGLWLFMPKPIRLTSAGVDKDNRNLLVLRFEDGSQREWSFPSRLADAKAVDLEARGQPLIAAGFELEGPLGGSLIVFDPQQFRESREPRPMYRIDEWDPPPKIWDHQPYNKPFYPASLLAVDLNDEPGDELIVITQSDHGLTHLVVYTRGWRRMSHVWHYGHIGCPSSIIDLDGDRAKELVCFGIANDRRSPEPFAAQPESLHSCVLVIDPRDTAEPPVCLSKNAWMNERSPRRPLAYGYVRFPFNMTNRDWGGDSTPLRPYPADGTNSPGSIRLHFANGLYLDLAADLTPVRLEVDSTGIWKGGSIPTMNEVWYRLWPSDEKTETEPPAGGE